ncbi:MAG: hypothetical protein RJA49_765 [Actinomycetota bacterium]
MALLGGLFGGVALGIAARAWMRLISTDPEFTWNGTIFIVLAFTIHGFTQAVARAVRRATDRRSAVTCARVVGFIGTLPLFVAAGGIMFPTVIGGSLARYRTDWSRWVRVVLVALALVPVGLVTSGLVDDWGWSWTTFAGMAGLIGVYGVVIAEERPTLAPQPDGWRMPRAARITIAVLSALAFLVPTVGASIT